MAEEQIINVSQENLPLYCPSALTDVDTSHPRVFLKVDEKHREVRCPYCSQLYRLQVEAE